jgi:hypothetical protein
VQPLRCGVNHVDDWIFAFTVSDAVHSAVKALLVKGVQRSKRPLS